MQITWTTDIADSEQHAASVLASGLPIAQPALLEELADASGDDFANQLRLRGGPLRDQWDARGPGLMRQLGRLTEPLVNRAPVTVALVAPLVGGGGEALPAERRVRFEAVLTNPHEALPEALRLAWLLAQLDQGVAAKTQAALAPAVLAAAEEVELARLDEPTLSLAIEAWRLADCDAASLFAWWKNYRASPLPWAAAVAAAPFR